MLKDILVHYMLFIVSPNKLCFLISFVALADDDTATIAWPSTSPEYIKVKQGSARQFLGSSFVRDDLTTVARLRSSTVAKNNPHLGTKNNAQHFDVTHSSVHPPFEGHHPDDDYISPDIPNYLAAHEVYTSEPLKPGQLPLSNKTDPRFRALGGRTRGRTDLYGVREYGERKGDMIRGREGVINMLHTKDKIFRPFISIINDETRLLSPNDGAGHVCEDNCKDTQWMCTISCACISKSERCNKIQNCDDGTDEYDCDNNDDMVSKLQLSCEQTGDHVMCPKTYRCINKDWLCDGDDDCGDYSDETHCGESGKFIKYFEDTVFFILYDIFPLGSRVNCSEDQFECQNGFCLPKHWVCDGENDCKDFSDEGNCSRVK